jgi:hypothetical protein
MSDRRSFIKQMIAGGVLLPSATRSLFGKTGSYINDTAEEKEVRIALIGK